MICNEYAYLICYNIKHNTLTNITTRSYFISLHITMYPHISTYPFHNFSPTYTFPSSYFLFSFLMCFVHVVPSYQSIDLQPDRQADRRTDRQTDRQAVRQTDGQAVRETYSQAYRQADRFYYMLSIMAQLFIRSFHLPVPSYTYLPW